MKKVSQKWKRKHKPVVKKPYNFILILPIFLTSDPQALTVA